MRYLKLFEAFESSKLSKVLNFLNKSSHSKFLKEVKDICDYLDYPLSKLTDDDFEYVPYQKAKYINRPDSDGKMELIKFWFDKDGNYVSKTLINGKQLNYDLLSKEFSTDEYNYTFGRQLGIGDLRSLPNGTKVYLECGDGSGVGYLYNYSGSSYILQDFASGTTPSDNDEYRKIKPQSWIISSTDDYYEMKLAYPKEDVLSDYEEGSDFNLGFTWALNDNKINFYNGDFKDANFALILDLTKLKGLSLKDIRKEREVRKERAFLTDKEIKKENIERYLNKILGADNFLSNPDKLIKRMLGGDQILFLLYTTSLISTLDKIENYYYQILKTDDDDDEIKLQNHNIHQVAHSHYKKMKQTKDIISVNTQNLFDDISTEAWDIGERYPGYLNDYKGNDEIDQVISDVVEEIKLLQQLSKDIFDSIGKIENIYDIESLRYKLGSIDRLLSSKRDNTYKLRDYLLRHFHSDKNTFYTVVFRKQYNEPRNFIENIYPRIEQVIKRL